MERAAPAIDLARRCAATARARFAISGDFFDAIIPAEALLIEKLLEASLPAYQQEIDDTYRQAGEKLDTTVAIGYLRDHNNRLEMEPNQRIQEAAPPMLTVTILEEGDFAVVTALPVQDHRDAIAVYVDDDLVEQRAHDPLLELGRARFVLPHSLQILTERQNRFLISLRWIRRWTVMTCLKASLRGRPALVHRGSFAKSI